MVLMSAWTPPLAPSSKLSIIYCFFKPTEQKMAFSIILDNNFTYFREECFTFLSTDWNCFFFILYTPAIQLLYYEL